MTSDLVRTSHDGSVATVSLDRAAARNALSVDVCKELTRAFRGLDETTCRVVVLRGEGPVFCSGADFAAVSGPEALGFLPAFEEMLEEVSACRRPVIARIQGAALGGGMQLATVCDFRIAARDARLGIPSSRLGIVINYENVERLVVLAGTAVAKEVLMTARTWTGAEALDAGLVTEAVAADELDAAVARMADRIAALAPRSVQGAKRAIAVVARQLSDARRRAPEEAAEIDAAVSDAYASEDLAEGIRAMRERRQANFSGA